MNYLNSTKLNKTLQDNLSPEGQDRRGREAAEYLGSKRLAESVNPEHVKALHALVTKMDGHKASAADMPERGMPLFLRPPYDAAREVAHQQTLSAPDPDMMREATVRANEQLQRPHTFSEYEPFLMKSYGTELELPDEDKSAPIWRNPIAKK